MNSSQVNPHDQSTPRRRGRGILGLRKVSRASKLTKLKIKDTEEYFANSTPISSNGNSTVVGKAESPCLPCNQVEYMCDTRSDSSIGSDIIPCSPGVLESGFISNLDNWDSFVGSKHNNSRITITQNHEENSANMEEVSQTKSGKDVDKNHINTTLLNSRCEKLFRDEIEQSFDMINQSICNINNENRSSLFETKDSFLLDIRESGIIVEQKVLKKNDLSKSKLYEDYVNPNTFYGLPMIVKGLFKTYRKIEKFYGKVVQPKI